MPLSDRVLDALVADGCLGVFRYVPLPNNSARFDISPGELARICAKGLQCGLVQHVRAGTPLWDPDDHDGGADAQAAVLAAQAAGYPEGAHLWQDLEGIGGTGRATVAFAVAWELGVIGARFAAALYHGYSVPLGALDLYDLPGFNSYWADGPGRLVATRGNAVVQGREIVIAGVKFDEDTVVPDALGELPLVAQMAPAVA